MSQTSSAVSADTFDRGLLAEIRFGELFPVSSFPDGFGHNYDEEDFVKCLDRLGEMPQGEFNKLKVRMEGSEFPPDPFIMMWAISAPIKNDNPPVLGPDGKPAWPRDLVLKYMDDQSGRQHSAKSLKQEAQDLASITFISAVQSRAKDGLFEIAEHVAMAAGHPMLAAAIKLGKHFVVGKEYLEKVIKTYKRSKEINEEMDGYVSRKRRPNEPWKECPADNPFHVFSAIQPKPTDWKKIDPGKVSFSRHTEIRVARCPLDKQVIAMRNPAMAITVADRYEQHPLGGQMITVLRKTTDQLLKVVHLSQGKSLSQEAANDHNGVVSTPLIAHRTLGAAAAAIGGEPSPQPKPITPSPAKPEPNVPWRQVPRYRPT